VAGQIGSDDPRLLNRRLLYWTMREAGFTNYPYEYWHYDYGDQMYVLTLRSLGKQDIASAWYSYIDLAL
jgi:D-alanyl-D-alanine dipeptidase